MPPAAGIPAPTRRRSRIRSEQTQFILANTTGQITNDIRSRRCVQQQLEEDRGAPAGADRIRSGRHELLEDVGVPELDAVRQPRLGGDSDPVLRDSRRLLPQRPARQQRHRRAAIHLLTGTNMRSCLGSQSTCSASPGSRAFRPQHSTERCATSRRARTSRPTARCTRIGRRTPVQVRRAGRRGWKQCPDRRSPQPRDACTGTPNCRAAFRSRQGRSGTTREQQRRRSEEGLRHRGRHPARRTSASSSRIPGPSRTASRSTRASAPSVRMCRPTRPARISRSSASSSGSRTSSRRASAPPTTSRATAGRSCSATGESSTTSSSSSCRAARSAATSGSSTYYTLDTAELDDPGGRPELPARLPGHAHHAPRGRNQPDRLPSPLVRTRIAIEPDLKPMRQQEASAGVEHQLNNYMAVSARYVHKQIDRAIEDTGFLLPDGSEGYVIANPGEGLTSLAYTDPQVALPKAVRDYDAVELRFEKRLSNNWYLNVGYTWSRLNGNYSGLTQSDENGRTSPNVGRLFDYPAMMFDQHGQPVFGPLATDRPNQFKTQFIYQFPFGTSFSVNQYLASGLPVSREIGIFPGSNYPGPVPGPEQRRPDGHVLADRPLPAARDPPRASRGCSSASTCSTCSTRTRRSRSSRPTRGRRACRLERNGALSQVSSTSRSSSRSRRSSRIPAS